MKQVMIRQGRAVVERVPAPMCEPGTVVVRVDHSCISIGTEMSGVRSSGRTVLQRVRERPEQVKRVLEMVSTHGVAQTRALVQGKLEAANPTGYSAAGYVLEVGEGVKDLRPGDRVACAGAQYAHHAEVIRVPRNLVVPVPDGMGLAEASTVTLGAIALQGVRRAVPTLGETFVVIGLGILGQLTAQLLAANGCRVVGTDLDRGRIAAALAQGMDAGLHPDDGSDVDQVMRLTDGIGADGVIITAAAASNAIVSAAFRMCRRKGRVVLVGDVGLDLDREDIYRKELDFFVSTSYGPGRYDERYEEHGVDYPVGYVRWTENRNMAEYLRLIAAGRVRVQPLVASVHPVDEADQAYAALSGDARPLMVLLSYPQAEGAAVHRVANPRARPGAGAGRVRMALVGAGSFARGMHLPNMQGLPEYHLRAVVSRTGANATSTAAQFGADYAATDYAEVLADPEVDAVLIATRHHLHAPMVLDALRAGKHVLVEKPLALTRGEVDAVRAFYDEHPDGPVLLTGFNRRFSVFARRAAELLAGRTNPMVVTYRMNAGHIPLDHWVHGPEGGGRNRGEACHIYDLFTFLTGSRVASVNAHAIVPTTGHYAADDNFVATATFEDGSVCTLVYTALGAKDFPKERMELFADGKVLVLDDYRTLAVHGARARGVELRNPDKGQRDELAAFARAILSGGEWPIPLWQQIQATEMALDVEAFLTGDRGGVER
jgi:predicted dehydrogenase/threonine dehydrogenase-like Zn-dependent dehydrogenase